MTALTPQPDIVELLRKLLGHPALARTDSRVLPKAISDAASEIERLRVALAAHQEGELDWKESWESTNKLYQRAKAERDRYKAVVKAARKLEFKEMGRNRDTGARLCRIVSNIALFGRLADALDDTDA